MVAVIQHGGAPTRDEFHRAIAAGAERWFSACLKITRSRELAEDALQDALLSAWQKRGQFQHGARLDTWIHRIAINAALQLLRRRQPDYFDPHTRDVEADEPGPDDASYAGELTTDLAAALGQLTDLERICFVLKHLEQWRLKEIAEQTDSSVDTVKQALYRGTRKLRGSMATLVSDRP